MKNNLILCLALALVSSFYFRAAAQTNETGVSTGLISQEVINVTNDLVYVDAHRLTFSQKLLLESVQAIANEKSPALFVLETGEDSSWLKAMEKRMGKSFEEISLDEALDRFAMNAPEVIYDPGKNRRWTISIATTLAGVHRALLTDHDLGHVAAFDCRSSLTNKIAAYRWALDELQPQCNQHQLVYLDDTLSYLRDYAIQQKAFVLNLDPLNRPQEVQLLNDILGRYPAQTRVFGWAKGTYADKSKGQSGVTVEDALVTLLSQRGKMLIAADFASNLSFYDQTGATIGRLSQPHLDRGIQLESGKKYILLIVSDGDNLQYDLREMRSRWLDVNRPQIPLAWTISPQLAEIGPAVLQTYYQEASARGGWDEFVAGPSGYAYVNPGSMSRVQLDDFVRQTQRACDLADIHSVAILDDGSRPADQVFDFINYYASAKFDGLWLIAMPQYLGVSGKMAFANERFRIGNVADVVQQIKGMQSDNPFAVIYTSCQASTLINFKNGLDNSCVIVSPTEMARLIRQWQAQKTGR